MQGAASGWGLNAPSYWEVHMTNGWYIFFVVAILLILLIVAGVITVN